MEYNQIKLKSWLDVQIEQLYMDKTELSQEIEKLFIEEIDTTSSLKKTDIQKQIIATKKKYDALEKKAPETINALKEEMDNCIRAFNKQFDINPILLVNVVLKF